MPVARPQAAIPRRLVHSPRDRAIGRAQPTGSELRFPGMLAASISVWATSYPCAPAAIVSSVFLAGTANADPAHLTDVVRLGQAQAAFAGSYCCR